MWLSRSPVGHAATRYLPTFVPVAVLLLFAVEMGLFLTAWQVMQPRSTAITLVDSQPTSWFH